MAGLFDGVGESFRTGQEIGRGIRTGINRRRVRTAQDDYEAAEAELAAARDAGDAAREAAASARAEEAARRAFTAADKLDVLHGENYGQNYLRHAAQGRGLPTATPASPTAMPGRELTTGAPVDDAYAGSRRQLDYVEGLSSRAGRSVDPGVREEVTSRAAQTIWGNNLSPALALAQEEAAKGGKWSRGTADKIVGSLHALSLYSPQLKGAQFSINPDDNSIWADFDGGGSGEGFTLKPENIQKAVEVFENAIGKPSALYGRQKADAEAKAAAQAKRVEEATKYQYELLKAAIPALTSAGLSERQAFSTATTVASGTKAAAANGIKHTPLDEDSTGRLPGADRTQFATQVDANGQTFYTAGGEGGTRLYYDGAGRPISPQQFEAGVTAGVANEDDARRIAMMYNLASSQRADAANTIFSMINALGAAAATGNILQLEQVSAPSIDLGGAPMQDSALPIGAAAGGVGDTVSVATPRTRGGARGRGGGLGATVPKETIGHVTKTLSRTGMPPDNLTPREKAEFLIDSVQKTESGDNASVAIRTRAVSPKGALGPFQIMPATARAPGYGLAPIDLDNSSYEQQREFAIRYLAKAIEQAGGDAALGIAFYNAGPNSGITSEGLRRVVAVPAPARALNFPPVADPAYWRNAAPRSFADGGVVDNQPFFLSPDDLAQMGVA